MATGAPQLWKASPLNNYSLVPISPGEVFVFSPGDRSRNLPPFLLTRLDTNCTYLFVIQRDWSLLNYKEEHILQCFLWIGGTSSQVAPHRQSIPTREQLPYAMIKVYEESWKVINDVKAKLESNEDQKREYSIHLSVEFQYQQSISFLDLGRNPIFNQIFVNYVDDDQLRAIALPNNIQQRAGLYLGFEIFKPKNLEHGLRIIKVHELKHYRGSINGHGGIVELDLVQKLATLCPGSLSYLNRIKDFLLRGYGINKVLPFTKGGAPQPYSIDLKNLYAHPLASLASPNDFSSFYYCMAQSEQEEVVQKKKNEEEDQEEEKKEGEEEMKEQHEDVIKQRLDDNEEREEGGRSRALDMGDLEKIYDDYDLAMHNHAENLKDGKIAIGSAYPILRSNKLALYRVQRQNADLSMRNKVRDSMKRQAVMTGRFMECESDESRITLKEIAIHPSFSLIKALTRNSLAQGSYLLKRFKQSEPEKELRKLNYELLDTKTEFIFNTREGVHFWSVNRGKELEAGLCFLSKLNWQQVLTFSGLVKDLHSELTCRPFCLNRAGEERPQFMGYFKTKRDNRVFDYLMLKAKVGQKVKKVKRATIVKKVEKEEKPAEFNPFKDRIRKNKEESAVQSTDTSNFSETMEQTDLITRTLTQDFKMKRQANLPSTFPLLDRYSLFGPNAQIKITYETDRQWQKRYPNLDIKYAPRQIFHPSTDSKGVFLSRIGGSTVDSLSVFEINIGSKFRKLDHQDIGRFDANKAYFIVALNKEPGEGNVERANAAIYLWRGESAAVLKDAGSAAQKFHNTEFKELSSSDKMIGIKRQSTAHRLSRVSGGVRPSIRAAMESLESKPESDIAEQLGIDKDLAEQLHPALLQGALAQKKEKDQGPVISILTPVNGSTTPNPKNLQPLIDDDSVDVSMRSLVLQDNEPLHFLLLFRGEILIRTNDYGVVDNDGIMFQLIGMPYISQRAREVPVTYSQLSSAGLFLLLTPDDACYFWIGREYYQKVVEPELAASRESVKKLNKQVDLGLEHLLSYKLFQRIIATVNNFSIEIEYLKVTIMVEGGETSPFLEYMQAVPSKREIDQDQDDDDMLDSKFLGQSAHASRTYERRILPLFSPQLKHLQPPSVPRFYCIFREGEVLVPSQGLIGGTREDLNQEEISDQGRIAFGQNSIRAKIMHKQLERMSESLFFKRNNRFNLGRSALQVGCIVKGADQGCIFLVDVGSEVFVWVGNRVSLKNKPYAMPLALHLLKEIEMQQRRDVNVQKRRVFVRKDSGEHEKLLEEEDTQPHEDEEQHTHTDIKDLKAERVTVNLINSGYEPALFLKLIGVGLPEE